MQNLNLRHVQTLLASTFATLGSTATVQLRDGPTFELKISDGFRQDADLTDGLSQSTHRGSARDTCKNLR